MECNYHNEFVGEIRQFHLEIKDRLARIETKQDMASNFNTSFQAEFVQMQQMTNGHSKQIVSLNSEIKNFKWTVSIMAGVVTALTQILFYLFKGGKI